MEQSNAIDRLLSLPPFGVPPEEREPLFAAAMAEAFRHHAAGCPVLRDALEAQGFDPGRAPGDLADYPYLPASLYKHAGLVSVPPGEITLVLESTATTGLPSRVAIDAVTARRQTLVSSRVAAAFLGPDRRPFLVLDRDPAAGRGPLVPARSAATRGFLGFASATEYLLGDAEAAGANLGRFEEAMATAAGDRQPVCLLGLTYLVYQALVRPILEGGRQVTAPPGASLIHLGGWKRLESIGVSRERLIDEIGLALGIGPDRVFDFYGFTEQMGLLYGNAGLEAKTVPAYADLIVRHPDTLRPCADGEIGLLQFVTPVPHSHPGISVLTDDIGRIVGRGRDARGRWGTRFELHGRAATAEPRGCGDLGAPQGPGGRR